MKRIITPLISLAVIGGLAYVAFQPKLGENVLGKPIPSDAPRVAIADLVRDDSYVGRMVVVEGKVGEQCLTTYCWFYLEDRQNNRIRADTSPGGFSLGKDVRGQTLTVWGKVTKGQRDLELVAYGVKL